MAAELTLKVQLDGDTRRLPLPGYSPEPPATDAAEMLLEMRTTICAGFGFEEEEEADNLVLKYADDEGDFCTLVESTLNDALKLASTGTLKLQAQMLQAPTDVPRTSSAAEVRSKGEKGKKGAWPKGEKGKHEKGDKGKSKGFKGEKGKHGEKGDKGKGKGQKGIEDEFVAKVPVDDQEIDLSFGFFEKIIGDNAANVRHIREHSGAHVWLKGKGSKGFGESDEPLHLQISSNSQDSVDRAVALSNDLLCNVLDEYDRWKAEDSDSNGKSGGKGKGKGKGKYPSKSKGKGASWSSEEDPRGYKRARTAW